VSLTVRHKTEFVYFFSIREETLANMIQNEAPQKQDVSDIASIHDSPSSRSSANDSHPARSSANGSGNMPCRKAPWEKRAEEIFTKMYIEPKELPNMWYPMSHIGDGLFLGGIWDPKNDDDIPEDIDDEIYYRPTRFIQEQNIECVISILEKSCEWKLPSRVIHYRFIVEDKPTSKIDVYFTFIADIIALCLHHKRKVLIHCRAGVSRSCTVVAAYFLRYGIPDKDKPTIEEVLEHIRKYRNFVSPNYGFIVKLLAYETLRDHIPRS
jgi:protein-tyrosine phosphatase